MNKKQMQILALAIITFIFTVLINTSDLISIFFSNAATVTAMVDLRPMLVELIITAIIFGALLVLFKTPKKRS
jgi:hypothetical protein